jgi:putative transposase
MKEKAQPAKMGLEVILMIPIHIRKLGRLFHSRGLLGAKRTPAWAVALALLVYPAGLSLRKTASLLARHGVAIAHTTVWYWIQTLAGKLVICTGPLPRRIVVDETWVKVGGRDCWIYAAIDPDTQRIMYVEPCFERDGWTTKEFFLHLYEVYGSWPDEVLTDGGTWYDVGLSFLPRLRSGWRVIRGGQRNAIEGWFGEFLKRRVKDFDKYFPSWDRQLRSVRNWLRVYCWWYNWSLKGGLPMSV